MEVGSTETVKKNTVSIRHDALAISILDPYIRFERNRKNRTRQQVQTGETKAGALFGEGVMVFQKKTVFNNIPLLVS